MDYKKVNEPCFVCEIEDNLGEARGTQSHPTNCGWRVKRENKGYKNALNEIMKLCKSHDGMSVDECISKIHETALSALYARYDVIEK